MIALTYGSLSKEEATRLYWERNGRWSAGLSDDSDQLAPPKLYQRDGEKVDDESAEQPESETESPADPIEAAAEATESNPSEAQREAGNYRKGRFRWNGLEVVIETPKGQRRRPEWPEMPAHYGYIRRTLSEADGDHVDVFIGPNADSDLVCVVDQVTPSGRFDEHKVVIGCTSESDARTLYASAYTPDWKVGPITAMTVDQFKAWLTDGDTAKRIEPQVSRYSRITEAVRAARLFKYHRIANAIRRYAKESHFESRCFANFCEDDKKYAAGASTFSENQHPRDESGKFSVADKIKSATKKRKASKLTIQKAAQLLSERGVTMIGMAPYDLANKQANYRIAMPDGTEEVWSSDQIKTFLEYVK